MVVPPVYFTWLQLQLQDANKNFSVAMLHCRILQLLYQVLGCDLTMLQSYKKKNNFYSSYLTKFMSSEIFIYFQDT